MYYKNSQSLITFIFLGFLALISLFLTVSVFVVVIRYFPKWVPNLMHAETAKSIDWGFYEGIASVITLSFIIGGLGFALFNYIQKEIEKRQREIEKKREDARASFELYKEVQDVLMKSEGIEARRWIILNLPTLREWEGDKESWLNHVNEKLDKKPRGWKENYSPGRQHLKQVLNMLDYIGFVDEHYWRMGDELVEWMSPPVAKVWQRIQPYVEDEATRRNEPDYYWAARKFGERCVRWRKERNFPEAKIVKHAT
jgi:hypothetical protein